MSDWSATKLAEDVLRNCVLTRVKPPEGTLKRRWMQAGTGNDLAEVLGQPLQVQGG